MKRGKNIQDFVDSISNKLFGIAESEVHENRCIGCNQDIDLESLAGLDKKEFEISKMCPVCFDVICKEDEDECS